MLFIWAGMLKGSTSFCRGPSCFGIVRVIMCGICLILNVPPQAHTFHFDFFKAYSRSSTDLPLNQHILKHKLLIDPINLHQLQQDLQKRGPHYFDSQCSLLLSQEALCMQSILHLRGVELYSCQSKQDVLLYNGEIWSTGSYPALRDAEGQSDTQWLHERLKSCEGNIQEMLRLFRQIRGDFAIIYITPKRITVVKDYFGKRSLLVGMGEKQLIISSVSPNHSSVEVEEGDEDEETVSWKAKYEAEWLSNRHKQMFELPANSLIQIELQKGQARWTQQRIHQVELRQIERMALSPEQISQTATKLLLDSVRELTMSIKGIANVKDIQPAGTKLALLFSGGVDSTLIARLLDLVLPQQEEIDLINLAFRADAPDRTSGEISFKQLQQLSPKRKYNIYFVDKTLQHIQVLKHGLLKAIYPKSTHMDFNIASALHVASQAALPNIIFTGLGADQIFGGYSRYRVAFKRGGYQEMDNEMIFDMERLWIRNLGRDDRAITSNGKEARYPFLYLPLWTYLRSVPLQHLTDGSGEKKLLRRVAKDLGLQISSSFKKKAIQFGTRLAKLSNLSSFGSNRKAKGTVEYT